MIKFVDKNFDVEQKSMIKWEIFVMKEYQKEIKKCEKFMFFWFKNIIIKNFIKKYIKNESYCWTIKFKVK